MQLLERWRTATTTIMKGAHAEHKMFMETVWGVRAAGCEIQLGVSLSDNGSPSYRKILPAFFSQESVICGSWFINASSKITVPTSRRSQSPQLRTMQGGRVGPQR
jgi:hypothetical protein